MVRRDDQRRLLYEMDMTITALRQKDLATRPASASPVSESDEVVRLTGCHHNLLRICADV